MLRATHGQFYFRNWLKLDACRSSKPQVCDQVDPLLCPKCKSRMKVVEIIDDKPTIKKILEQIGWWKDEIRGPGARRIFRLRNTHKGPIFEELPKPKQVFDDEIILEPFDDGLVACFCETMMRLPVGGMAKLSMTHNRYVSRQSVITILTKSHCDFAGR